MIDHHADLYYYSAHWNNSPWVDMSLHSDTLFWFRANQSLLLNATCFDLTRPELEPTIYRTWGEHANHYITDTVSSVGQCGGKEFDEQCKAWNIYFSIGDKTKSLIIKFCQIRAIHWKLKMGKNGHVPT